MNNQQFNKNNTLRKPCSRAAATGFTMVEVVVALAILSTSVLAVFGAMHSCLTASGHARMLTRSVLLAESLLTEARLNKDLTFETTQGQQGLYDWKVQIAPTPVENLAAIYVRVKWQRQQRPQQYELFSLLHMKTFIEGK